ncbi:uncharacterized protein G2W53_029538 [Senna tora]|uniref:Uncharacterized protein n=1 Tax=Senna tora TaxID=362788 RepID=A0A834WFU7_9FABA|nr:uncharacterized protein G2W53_029538 [Senna tora]
MSHTSYSTLILRIRNSNKGPPNRTLSTQELKLKNCLFLLKRKKKHQTSIITGFYLRGSLKNISDQLSLDVLVVQKHGHLALIQGHFMHHNEAIISKDIRHLLQQHNISLRIASDSLIQELQGFESCMPPFVFSGFGPFSLAV